MSHGLFYQCIYYVSGPGNISVVLLSMEGQIALRFHQKYLNLCSEDERRSYGFGTTWGWVINDRFFILGWTNPLRFRGWHLATRTFRSLHRFSMGFRSGDWLGHSRTLMCFFLSHSFVALAMCFGSLSCWNTHPRPIFNALPGFNALAWRYMAPSIVPLMLCSCPVP